jgi:hypothetical protein
MLSSLKIRYDLCSWSWKGFCNFILYII